MSLLFFSPYSQNSLKQSGNSRYHKDGAYKFSLGQILMLSNAQSWRQYQRICYCRTEHNEIMLENQHNLKLISRLILSGSERILPESAETKFTKRRKPNAFHHWIRVFTMRLTKRHWGRKSHLKSKNNAEQPGRSFFDWVMHLVRIRVIDWNCQEVNIIKQLGGRFTRDSELYNSATTKPFSANLRFCSAVAPAPEWIAEEVTRPLHPPALEAPSRQEAACSHCNTEGVGNPQTLARLVQCTCPRQRHKRRGKLLKKTLEEQTSQSLTGPGRRH